MLHAQLITLVLCIGEFSNAVNSLLYFVCVLHVVVIISTEVKNSG